MLDEAINKALGSQTRVFLARVTDVSPVNQQRVMAFSEFLGNVVVMVGNVRWLKEGDWIFIAPVSSGEKYQPYMFVGWNGNQKNLFPGSQILYFEKELYASKDDLPSSRNGARLGQVRQVGTMVDDLVFYIYGNVAGVEQWIPIGCTNAAAPIYEIPPLTTAPVTIDPEHCTRMQALIAALSALFTKLDTLTTTGISFSSVQAAYSQVIGDLSLTSVLSPPSATEIAQLNGMLVAFFSGTPTSLVTAYDTLDLLHNFYVATTAAEAKAAYDTAVDASAASPIVKSILKSAAYNNLFNLYFGVAAVNNGGYDGNLCTPSECVTIDSVSVSFPIDGISLQAIVWPEAFPAVSTVPSGYFAASAVWTTRDLTGWTLTCTETVNVYPQYNRPAVVTSPGTPIVLGECSLTAIVGHSTPFSVELCPPS